MKATTDLQKKSKLNEVSKEVNGKTYVSAFGHYSVDGEPITRDQYLKATGEDSGSSDSKSSDTSSKVSKIISKGWTYQDAEEAGNTDYYDEVSDYLGMDPNKLVAIYSDSSDPEGGPSDEINPDYEELIDLINFDSSKGKDVLGWGDAASAEGELNGKKVVAINDYGLGVIFIEK